MRNSNMLSDVLTVLSIVTKSSKPVDPIHIQNSDLEKNAKMMPKKPQKGATYNYTSTSCNLNFRAVKAPARSRDTGGSGAEIQAGLIVLTLRVIRKARGS